MEAPRNRAISRQANSDVISNPIGYDDASIRGRFGWTEIGWSFVPYIFRYGQKYCATVMAYRLLKPYLSRLHKSLSSCVMITSYRISEAECQILNEINFVHCDSIYGTVPFTPQRGAVVKLSDVAEFYKFLFETYSRLTTVNSGKNYRNGFLQIDQTSVVPYVVVKNLVYLPLEYFQGSSLGILEDLAVDLSGWDLPYLRLCSKIQKIRDNLFAAETVKVNRYADVVNLFPTGTSFQRHWPEMSFYSHLLVIDDPHLCWTHWVKPPISAVTLPILRPLAEFCNGNKPLVTSKPPPKDRGTGGYLRTLRYIVPIVPKNLVQPQKLELQENES